MGSRGLTGRLEISYELAAPIAWTARTGKGMRPRTSARKASAVPALALGCIPKTFQQEPTSTALTWYRTTPGRERRGMGTLWTRPPGWAGRSPVGLRTAHGQVWRVWGARRSGEVRRAAAPLEVGEDVPHRHPPVPHLSEPDQLVPAFAVTVVDTTAAGDAFVGGLAAAYRGLEQLREAVRFANAVGALACTRLGAQPALPSEAEVAALLARGSG